MRGLRAVRTLRGDVRGVILVEFAIAIPTVFIMFFGMLQWMMNAQVHVLVRHAAFLAARAEAVVHPGMADGGTESDVTRAAQLALQTRFKGKVSVTQSLAPPLSQQPQSVTVAIDLPCEIPLGNIIACGVKRKIHLAETSSFPNQGAAYQAIWGSGG
jgi:hypothetical protein